MVVVGAVTLCVVVCFVLFFVVCAVVDRPCGGMDIEMMTEVRLLFDDRGFVDRLHDY